VTARWWRCCSGMEAVEEKEREKRKTGGGVLGERGARVAA
jgi:hypothetical protein